MTCIHDWLEIYTWESGVLYDTVVENFMTTGTVTPPRIQTVAVETIMKQIRGGRYPCHFKTYVFTGLYFYAELGEDFCREINLRGVDALRFLPRRVGEKVWLFCQTHEPLRGQEQFWTRDNWYPFVFSLVCGVWICHTGIFGINEVSTWHLFQTFRRVKIYGLAR